MHSAALKSNIMSTLSFLKCLVFLCLFSLVCAFCCLLCTLFHVLFVSLSLDFSMRSLLCLPLFLLVDACNLAPIWKWVSMQSPSSKIQFLCCRLSGRPDQVLVLMMVLVLDFFPFSFYCFRHSLIVFLFILVMCHRY